MFYFGSIWPRFANHVTYDISGFLRCFYLFSWPSSRPWCQPSTTSFHEGLVSNGLHTVRRVRVVRVPWNSLRFSLWAPVDHVTAPDLQMVLRQPLVISSSAYRPIMASIAFDIHNTNPFSVYFAPNIIVSFIKKMRLPLCTYLPHVHEYRILNLFVSKFTSGYLIISLYLGGVNLFYYGSVHITFASVAYFCICHFMG